MLLFTTISLRTKTSINLPAGQAWGGAPASALLGSILVAVAHPSPPPRPAAAGPPLGLTLFSAPLGGGCRCQGLSYPPISLSPEGGF